MDVNERGSGTAQTPKTLESTLVVTIMLLVALLVPFVYQTSIGFGASNIIRAFFWEYGVSGNFTGFAIIQLSVFLNSLLYIIIHFLFVYVMWSFYEKKVSRAQTITIGILLELLKIGPSLPTILTILMAPGPFYVLILPFPVLLLIGLVMMFAFPPPKITAP